MSLKAMPCVHKPVASISLLISMVWTCIAYAQHSEPSASRLSAWNDNSLIEIQKKLGDPDRSGDVKIEFYGHDAFKITSPAGLTILTDPWANDSTGQFPTWFLSRFPAIRVDIILSTHAHFDHDAVERPKGLVVLERLVGQFKLGDLEVTGLAEKHQCDPLADVKSKNDSVGSHVETCPPNNAMEFDNAIQIIRTGGLRIAIWGDNRAVPASSLDHYLEDLDVLVLPVDNVLPRPEINGIIGKYDPKAVIPSHYFIRGLTTETSGLKSADSWVNEQERLNHGNVDRLDGAELTLNPGKLKRSHRRVYYFADHFEK